MAELKDGGARREFGTGARRDIAEGKGRCDLLPLDVVGNILSSPVLRHIEEFKALKRIQCLENAIFEFVTIPGLERDIRTEFLELSIHFEDGARKYGENNWKKGIPLHCYIDSGVRHYLKHLRGDDDEPHDRAFLWNIVCAIWTFKHMPELDDIEKDLEKKPESEIVHEQSTTEESIKKILNDVYGAGFRSGFFGEESE